MTTIYSDRLGIIHDDQFAAALARFGLGDFVAAVPTTSGLFGQNVFVISTVGEYVLRGAPHWVKDRGSSEWRPEDRWQFTKEAFFVTQLHDQTTVPVPWPYLHDAAPDIFGWPYVWMPRMPGQCFDERSILRMLDDDARCAVAQALGDMLARMQSLSGPFAGDFDTRTIELTRHPGGAVGQVIEETREQMRQAEEQGAISTNDVEWIEQLITAAAENAPPRCTYVHCDYKLNNVAVMEDTNGFCVSGLFDFHEARFGDGLIDIVRQACSYIDTEPLLARIFVDAYRTNTPTDSTIGARLPLYVVNDRMKLWAYFTRPSERAAWTRGKTFRGWAQRYADNLVELTS